MNKTAFAFASLLAFMGTAQAQVAPAPGTIIPAPMRFTLGFNAVGGGDELVVAERTNGDSDTIKAGRGVTAYAGVDYQITPVFSMLASIGYQSDRKSADNGTLKFTRVPVELLAFFHPSANWRVGGGLRYVSNATLSGSGVVNIGDIEFDNTTSGVIEAEYLAGRNWGFQLRYVHERFKVDGYNGKINADQAGLGVRYYF